MGEDRIGDLKMPLTLVRGVDDPGKPAEYELEIHKAVPGSKYIKLDNAGHIPVNLSMETEVKGLYAAGDIRQHSASQLVTSAGDGATAAIAAFNYIHSQTW